MLDLGCRIRAFQPESLFLECCGKLVPVYLGICHLVGVHSSGGAAELGRIRHGLKKLELLVQPFHKDLDFFAQKSR